MKLSEIIRRAEKELSTATRNLDMGKRRGAPEQDIKNLKEKVEYKHFVVWILQEMNGGRMDYKELVWKLKNDALWQNTCEQAATAITELLVENQSLRNAANGFKARAEAAEARAEKAERERDEAVRICAKLIALCSPPKEWVPKLFQRHINRPGDYMGCGYIFLDGFNLIIENFVETADDELYTAIRDATEKEIIERSMRMSGKKEE